MRRGTFMEDGQLPAHKKTARAALFGAAFAVGTFLHCVWVQRPMKRQSIMAAS